MDKKLLNYNEYLTKWISTTINKIKVKSCILGLSGGIDSALVLALLKQNENYQVIPIYIDIESDQYDLKCAKLIAQKFDTNLKIVDLTSIFKLMVKTLKLKTNDSISNLKSRLRAITLYSYAAENKGVVVGTSNANERYVGYFTKFGDSACDIMLISQLLKSEIYELSRFYQIPQEIINRKPSAGLYPNQEDEKELNFSYQQLSDYMINKPIDLSKSVLIRKRHLINLHKLKLPLQPKPFNTFKK